MLLSLENVGFRRNGRDILRNISFTLPENHILTIVGPNGAGKSTLMSLILGLQRPSSGRIQRAPDLTISFIPQRFQLPPDLPMTAARFLADVPGDRRDYWLQRLGIGHLLASPLQSLSGGETQRLLLVRALLRAPRLLVLDEPASGIDPSARDHYYQIIKQFSQDTGASILLVSHDIHLVLKASHRVICLNQHICCQGTPLELSQQTDFCALVGVELGFYSHHHDHQHCHDPIP